MNKIGEIVESTSTEFTAECYELHELPALGSLVKVTAVEMEISGLSVNQAQPASSRAGIRWHAAKTRLRRSGVSVQSTADETAAQRVSSAGCGAHN